MSGEIKVNSTTDTVREMEEAVQMYGHELISSNEAAPQGEEAESTPTVTVETSKPKRGRSALEATEDLPESGPVVVSTTDSNAAIREVQKDLDEDREEKRDSYLGKSARRRIGQLTKQRYELLAEIETLKQQPPAPPAPSQPADEQQQSFNENQALFEQQQQQLAAERHRIVAEATLPYRIEAAKQRYPDLEEAVSRTTAVVPPEVLYLIQTLDDGFDVGYYLCKHPEKAREITQAWNQGNRQQAGAILEWISNGLSFSATHGSAPQQTRNGNSPRPRIPPPPPPIRPVGATSRSTVDLDQLPYRAYRDVRNAEERRNR